MALTLPDLEENINALEAQGAPHDVIQEYLDSLTKTPEGTYVPRSVQPSQNPNNAPVSLEPDLGTFGDIGKGAADLVFGKLPESLGQGLAFLGKNGINAQEQDTLQRQLQLNEQIAREYKQTTDPAKKQKLRDLLGQNTFTPLAQRTDLPTTGQVVGQGLQLGSAAMRLGIPASLGAPASVLGAVGQGLAPNAALGLGTALENKKSGSDLIGPTLLSTGVGSILDSLGYALAQKLARDPVVLYRKALKPTLSELEANPNMIENALKYNLSGDLNKLSDVVREGIPATEQKIQGLIAGAPDTRIQLNPVAEALAGLKNYYENIPGETSNAKAVDSVLKAMTQKGEDLPLKEAFALRRSLDAEATRSFGQVVLSESPGKVAAQRVAADALRRTISEAKPELSPFLQYQGALLGLKDTLQRASLNADKSSVAFRIIRDIMVAGGGSAYGVFTGHSPEERASRGLQFGALGALGAEAVTNPDMLTKAAVILNNANKLGPIFGSLGAAAKQGLLKIFAGAVSQ